MKHAAGLKEVFKEDCIFCKIVRGTVPSFKVFEDDISVGFLDNRPIFPGHTLLTTKSHIETLMDLPSFLISPVFTSVRLLSRAVAQGMQAEGAFVGINNRVSQSVPHFHVHIVPRRKGDGLKGFFWPRRAYKDQQEIDATLHAIRSRIAELKDSE